MTGPDRPTPPGEEPGQTYSTSVPSVGWMSAGPTGTAVEAISSLCPVSSETDVINRAARDWWPLAVQWAAAGRVPALPAVVARPADAAQVSRLLAHCHSFRLPVTLFGGRSGVCGGSLPVDGGVSVDMTGMSGIVDVDPTSCVVRARPGTFGDELEHELGERFGLTLGHWPQSMAMSTVGGWLACRSAGQYSTRYGKIEDLVVGLEVVLADGRIVRTGTHSPRAAAGPDLNQLFVGSEGVLGVITEATLGARPAPAVEEARTFGFPTMEAGLEACRRVLQRGATPGVLRLYDPTESERSFGHAGGCLLVVVDEGDAAMVSATMRVVREECRPAVDMGPDYAVKWLEERNAVPSLSELASAGIVADTIEIAGSWSALPRIYEDARRRVEGIDSTIAFSAHQSHAYTGGACVYFTFAGQPGGKPSDGDGYLQAAARYYTQAWDAVMSATTEHDGAISHHHGIGINRARYMDEYLGSGMAVLQAIKGALDPNGILNPGRLGLKGPFGSPTF